MNNEQENNLRNLIIDSIGAEQVEFFSSKVRLIFDKKVKWLKGKHYWTQKHRDDGEDRKGYYLLEDLNWIISDIRDRRLEELGI